MEETGKRADGLNAEFVLALSNFCQILDIDSNQSFDKTVKQFLVVSAVPKEQLSNAYDKIGHDLASVKYRAGRNLDIYSDPTTHPTYSESFWGDLFQIADISAVNDIEIYHNYKQLMAKPLDSCTEKQKVLAYYLTVMRNKRGGYIASNLISKEVGSSIDSFKEIEGKDMAKGLGSIIASLKFPQCVEVKLSDITKYSQTTTTPVTKKKSDHQVQEPQKLSNVPQKKWDTTAKRNYSSKPIIKRYREMMKVKSHYPGKSTFKHVLGSVVASSNDWNMISSDIGVSKINKSFTQNDLREELFKDTILSEDWMPLLSILDHCQLDKLMECADVKTFTDMCQRVLPVETFAKWSNVGTAKKFLTIYTPGWDKIWSKNWNMSHDLRRAIMKYKKTRDKLDESTINAICEL